MYLYADLPINSYKDFGSEGSLIFNFWSFVGLIIFTAVGYFFYKYKKRIVKINKRGKDMRAQSR